jgi:hypothetical protein
VVSSRNRRGKGQDSTEQLTTSGEYVSKRRKRRRGQEDVDGPARPESWRDMVSTDYDYPAEMEELSRRDRRHAKKEWRRDDHTQRMAWLRDQRQAEPVSPVSVLVVVVLLGILVLGIGGGLPKILGKDEAKQPVGLLTPAGLPPLPTATGSSGPTTTEPSATTPTTPPLETSGPSPAAITDSNKLVTEWARKFYTRTPATQSYDQLVSSASQYMTADLAASFTSQGDSTYVALKADRGTSKVVSATVAAPKEGTAPTDTPGRISRLLTVVIDITGSEPQRITVPLLVTVVQQDTGWAISDVDGGTGP